MIVRAAVVGGTGYAGAELVRILSGHPHAELTMITSRQHAGMLFSEIYPAMAGIVDLRCEAFSEEALAEAADVVFTALPHKASMEVVPDTKAWLKTLKALRRARYSKTTIIPGRGPLCDQSATSPLSEYIALARRRARSLRTAGRTRVDKAAAVAELLSRFPVSDDELELVQRRVKAGLDRLCEEVE